MKGYFGKGTRQAATGGLDPSSESSSRSVFVCSFMGPVHGLRVPEGKEHTNSLTREDETTVQISPLAPRLGRLDGKIIYVNMGESERAESVLMPHLYKQLKSAYPNTDWRWIGTRGFGRMRLRRRCLAMLMQWFEGSDGEAGRLWRRLRTMQNWKKQESRRCSS